MVEFAVEVMKGAGDVIVGGVAIDEWVASHVSKVKWWLEWNYKVGVDKAWNLSFEDRGLVYLYPRHNLSFL